MKHVMSETTETKVTNVKEDDIQPNAIDLRIGKIFTHITETEEMHDRIKTRVFHDFHLVNDEKIHLPQKQVMPNENGVYALKQGYYLIEFENRIKVGAHESGLVVPRSTLMRNGVVLFTCLYDSGYCGKMIAGMQVFSPRAYFGEHERIGQYLCFDAESLHQYHGSYQEASL